MKVFTYIALFSAITLGYMVQKNPLIFGRRTGQSHDGFEIITSHPALDAELETMKEDIGDDYEAYRNHCLRVLTFTKFHLPDTVEKSIPNALDLAAVALAYHDAALWTKKKLSYLEPSAEHLDDKRGEYTDEEVELMKDIVMYHHKYTDFKSSRSSDADALVNAVRKGDWADASLGIVRYGLPAVLLEAAYDNIPEAGFHMVLNDFPAKLSPDSLLGQLDVLKILKW
jgi:hypothetical protein